MTKDLNGKQSTELVQLPFVKHVHLTGGNHTHDNLISSQYFRASLTAELGCVTPWIIVPDSAPVLQNPSNVSRLTAILFLLLFSQPYLFFLIRAPSYT